MNLSLKLAGHQLAKHKLRAALVTVAIAMAAAIVVVIVGGYISALSRVDEVIAAALGRFDNIVSAGTQDQVLAEQRRAGISPPLPGLSDDVRAWMRESDLVVETLELASAQVEIYPDGQMFRAAEYQHSDNVVGSLLGTTASTAPAAMIGGSWLGTVEGQATGHEMAAVVDSYIARQLGVNAGDRVQIVSEKGRTSVAVVGILNIPGGVRGFGGVYVRPATFAALTGVPFRVNQVLVALREGVESKPFADALAAQVAESGEPLVIQKHRSLSGQLQSSVGLAFGGMAAPRYAAGVLVTVIVMFIVFNTMTMSVQEQTRTLALLRAVGMTRGQAARLILTEALLLAAVGFLIGAAIGIGIVQYLLGMLSATYGTAIGIDYGVCLALAAVCAVTAAGLGAALPAFIATRKRPLDVLTQVYRQRPATVPLTMPVIALLLIAVNPLATLAGWEMLAIGSYALTMIGFVLLIPPAVRLLERPFSRLAGRLMGLDARLIGQQLSANMWRTVGSLVTLMVGFGLFVMIQIWGQSMMAPFLLTENRPDSVVTIAPTGLTAEQAAEVAAMPGVARADAFLLQHPQFAPAFARETDAAGLPRDVVYLAGNLRALLGDGKTPAMIETRFMRGSASDAFAQIETGHACLVTDKMYLAAPDKFDVGQTIALETIEGESAPFELKIAGVVQIPGWHLLTKSARMRRGLGDVAGVVMVSETTLRAAYPAAMPRNFWLRFAPDAAATATLDALEKRVRALAGMPESESASGAVSDPFSDDPAHAAGQSYVRVTDVAAMTRSIESRSKQVIWGITVLPLFALALASLAVVNTLVASIHARSREFGVLRSLGMTRGQLGRLVLSEALLIGLIAAAMSVVFGVLTSWTGIRISEWKMNVVASMVVPWPAITIGLAVGIALVLGACVWPVRRAVNVPPLDLIRR